MLVASGTVSAGTYTPIEIRTVGQNTIFNVNFIDDIWTGTIAGLASNEVKATINPSGANIHILFTVIGEVNGRSGTLTIEFQGNAEGGPGTLFEGTWRILSGTEDLENLNGGGDFQGIAGVIATYSGIIHFNP